MRLVKILALLLAACVVQADVFEVENTGITFDAPDEFEPLSQEVIELKWPNRNAPRFVVGNLRATTTIAYDLKPRNISSVDIEELRGIFETALNRMIPGIQWKRNEVWEHEGRDWLYFEMTSNAIDTDIYNIMLVMPFEEQMVIFNFNSTKEDFPRYEGVLRKSVRSIRLPAENEET